MIHLPPLAPSSSARVIASGFFSGDRDSPAIKERHRRRVDFHLPAEPTDPISDSLSDTVAPRDTS